MRIPSRLYLSALIVVLMTSITVPVTAQNDPIEVTTVANSGPGSLREAVESANQSADADTIIFSADIDGISIALTEVLLIEEALTIDGTIPGGSNIRITPDLLLQEPPFIVNADLTLNNLEMSGGNGAILQTSGRLTIDNVLFNNVFRDVITSSGNGLTLTNSDFRLNTGLNTSISVYVLRGGATLENVRFTDNNIAAIDVLSDDLSMTDVRVEGTTSGTNPGVIMVRQNAYITTAENVRILSSSTPANGGGLYIDSLSGQPMSINRGVFSTNNGGAGAYVAQGNVAFTNSQFIDGTAGGLRVGAGGNVTLNFSTIAGNTGAGLQNDGTVNAKNIIIGILDRCSTGSNPITIKDRNVIPSDTACTVTPFDGDALRIDADPILEAEISVPATFYRPVVENDISSPTVDRALDCNTFDDAAVTVDSTGATRPQRANCDVGGYEVPTDSVQAGRFVAEIDQPTLPLEEADPVSSQREIDVRLNTFPIAPVNLTVTNNTPAQCQLLVGGTPTDPIALKLDQTTWQNTDPEFQVQAIDDAVSEGDHTCDLTVSFASVDGSDGAYETSNDLVNIPVNITDDDLVVNPRVIFDENAAGDAFASLDGVEFQETDPDTEQKTPENPAPVTITLENPPVNPVKVWMVSERADPQCQYSEDSFTTALTLNAANWDEGVQIFVSAIDDGVYEPNQTTCNFRGEGRYEDDSDTNSDSGSATMLADPTPNLVGTDDIPSDGILEGESALVSYELEPEVSNDVTGVSEFVLEYELTGEGTQINPNCTLGNGSTGTPLAASGTVPLTLRPDGDFVFEVFAVADGVSEDDGQACRLTVRLFAPDGVTPLDLGDLDNEATRFIPVREFVLPDEANLIIRDEWNDEEILAPYQSRYTADGLVEEGSSDAVQLSFRLDVETVGFVTVRLEEDTLPETVDDDIGSSPFFGFTGFPESFTDSQCTIQAEGGATSPDNTATLLLQDTTFQTVTIAPRDDAFYEQPSASPHRCVVEVLREGVELFEYVINLDDTADDAIAVNTIPDMPNDNRPAYSESLNQITILYVFTLQPSSEITLLFDNQTPNVCAFGFAGIRYTPNALQTNVGLAMPPLTLKPVAQTSLCTIRVFLGSDSPVPSNWGAAVAAAGGNDAFIPDIRLIVLNDEDRIDPTSTPDDGTPSGPTAIATVVGELTTTPDFGVVPIPTEVPIPSVSLKDGVNVLPVRTGPYLGATFVTIAVRETPSGEPEFYRVLARNNDEAEDITWFKIVANGKVGWASGRSLDLNNITEEELPVEGSIFDQIENVPDIGVQATILRDRQGYRRPSTRAARTGLFIPEGAVVSIIGRTREFPYDDWYQVRYNGQTGWIMSEIRQEDPAIEVNPDQVRELVPVR